MLCNTIQELPVTIKEIRNKAKIGKYITLEKKQIINLQFKKIDSEKIFSICDRILMYSKQVVIPGLLKKKLSLDSKDESSNEKLCFLAEYGQRNRRKCEILQRLYNSSKGTTSKIYSLTKNGQNLVKVACTFCWPNEGTILFNSGWLFLKMASDEKTLHAVVQLISSLDLVFLVQLCQIMEHNSQQKTSKIFMKPFLLYS